ncbi:MAG: hypothetical protein WCL30_07130, partial [Pseudomonadota bacterium]
IAQLPEQERKLFELTHDVVMKRQLFLDNSAEVNILARSVIKSDAHLIHPAIVKKKIEWTKIIIAGSLGAAGGLFLCLSWILFQNRNMHSIRTPQILQKIAKLPVLAAIPYSAMAEQKSKRLGMSNYLIDARDDAALEIKNIEKNIHKIIRGASNNIILFASHIANQGKSFIAGNLSLFAAEGRRTLLIDMDIVKGSLHLNFANLRSPGFSDLILGTATLNQVLANPIDNKLWFIPAGTEALNYNLLQDHEKLRSLMNMLSKSFDLVIVDYPTLGLQINNLKILDFAGSIFLVIRQGDRAMRLKRFLLKYPQKLTEISATLLNDVK